MMEIKTSRFGILTVDEQRLMTFPRGLLGFPNRQRFALFRRDRGITSSGCKASMNRTSPSS